MSWQPIVKPDADTAREPRTSKLLSLEVSNDRYKRIKIVVRNISGHGLGARGDINLLPCERVTVHLPDGRDIGATVRWVRKGTFGLSLDEHVDAAHLQAKASGGTKGALMPRDSEIGFTRIQHEATNQRSGFQRSHRDEVLRSSDWTRD